MIGIAVVLLLSGGWLLALLAVGSLVGRICGLNDRLPPPRRWVADSGRTARVSFTRAEDGAPLPSGQNPSGHVAERATVSHTTTATNAEIARDFGVSPRTVSRICREQEGD